MAVDRTSISWTDSTWNVLRGCTRVSSGCGGPHGQGGCYAERFAIRFSAPGQPYHGLVRSTPAGPRWTGEVRFVEESLALPLRWTKPRRIFVNSMSDLFHEKVPDEWIAAIFAVMHACPLHTFQVLTKRPERMRSWCSWLEAQGGIGPYIRSIRVDGDRSVPDLFSAVARTEVVNGRTWRAADDPWMTVFNAAAVTSAGPPENVWLGVSVEDQATADERIPLLLQTPAAVRWVSYEPALGPVDLKSFAPFCWERASSAERAAMRRIWPQGLPADSLNAKLSAMKLDWIVVGGESCPGARPFDLAWARSVIAQGKAAEVPVFVKQLGSQPRGWCSWKHHNEVPPKWLDQNGILPSVSGDPPVDLCHAVDAWWGPCKPKLRDRKGGDPEEWPADLRVREYPA